MRTPSSEVPALLPLTDPTFAAAAYAVGGELTGVEQEPGRERVTFVFSGLPATFVEDVIGGRVTVVARDFIAGLEHVKALLAQLRARRGREGR